MRLSTWPRSTARAQKFAFALAILVFGAGGAVAADLGYAPRAPVVAPSRRVVTAPNPWCRIVPGPHRDLVGDTNFFSPMAVCYSAGVLADSYDYGSREPRPQPSFAHEILKPFGIWVR